MTEDYLSMHPDTGEPDELQLAAWLRMAGDYAEQPDSPQTASRTPEMSLRLSERERIDADRERRRLLTEENRRRAGFAERSARIAEYGEAAEQRAAKEIDVDIPTEKKKTEPLRQKQKSVQPKKKNTKQSESRKSRMSTGGRYEKEERRSNRNRSRISTGGAVTLGILTGVLIGTVIYGRVQTNEVYTEIAALQTEYDDLVARNISMKSEMEGKLTVKNIEDFAEDELGLMPLNQSQIEYIQLQTVDEVTITEPEDNFFVSVNDRLISIWEYLRGK